MLAVWPPPAPALPGTTRFPANLEAPSDTIYLAPTGGPDVWGRAGARPDAQLADWINFAIDNDGDVPFGSWIAVFRWLTFAGLARTDQQVPYIAIELRTAAEIHAASGDPDSFGYTSWSDTAGMPAQDGLTSDGRDITYWSGSPDRDLSRFIRILIREDLASGGAGPEWEGRAFFVESVIHELGHATMMLLTEMYGSDFVVQNLCDLFGRPVADFADPGLSWADRVVEMTAEFFKDVCFPRRQFKNRTNGRITQARFDDFITLMFKLIESPYWDAGNIDELHAVENTSLGSLGSTAIVHDRDQAPLMLMNDAFVTPAFIGGTRRSLKWDGVTLPELYVHYNFDALGTAADPGAGARWSDLQDGSGVRPGYPVYNFNTEAGFSGDPGNNVRWGLQFDIYTLDRTFVNPGTFIGTAPHPIWTPTAYVGDRDAYIPPSSDTFTLVLGDIEFAPGYTALPEEGFSVWPTILPDIDTTQPKYTLFPSEPTSGEPQGLSLLWPWLSYLGERANFFIRSIPWPYRDGFVNVGPAATALHQPDMRITQGASARVIAVP